MKGTKQGPAQVAPAMTTVAIFAPWTTPASLTASTMFPPLELSRIPDTGLPAAAAAFMRSLTRLASPAARLPFRRTIVVLFPESVVFSSAADAGQHAAGQQHAAAIHAIASAPLATVPYHP
jgi:hypothetical protein